MNGINFTLYLFVNENTELFEIQWVCRHHSINPLPIPCKPLLYCAVRPFFGGWGFCKFAVQKSWNLKNL